MLSSCPSSRQGILDPRTFTFWHYQVSGWILMYCADLAITSLRAPSVREFLTTSLEVPLAFLLSLLLREVYATIEYKALSIVSLIGAILLWSAVFTVIWYALATVLWHVSMGPEYSARMLHFPELIRQIDFLMPIWVGWSSLYFGINYWRDWEVERERARKAVSLARRAQLEMLRYQLNPHFLFNALNSVRALVDEDRAVAKEMVTELSAFLRYSLSHNEAPDVPLSDELAAIRHYLSIEKRRFEDKLDVRFDIQPDAERFRVLSFLVHPLVENAVKYGMKTSSMPLHVGVSARLEEGALALTVSNSGSWYRGSGSGSVLQGTGTGLENVRRRLENAYAGRHTLTTEEEAGQVEVRMEIRPPVRGGA
jgi:two-component system, LytTR family, sensor kinase